MHNILVVDDDHATLSRYQKELASERYEVATAGLHEDLLEMIAQQSPELIVLHIKKEGAYGLDILRKIRNSFEYNLLKCSDLADLKVKIKMAIEGRLEFLEIRRAGEGNKAVPIPVITAKR